MRSPNALATALVVVGTRPELIKLAGLIRELRDRDDGVVPYVVFTGQHVELVDDAAADLAVEPDMRLGGMPSGRSLTDLMAHVVGDLGRVMSDLSPTCVVVQGDTASALAGAMTSELLDIPLVHVEAGVRSQRRDDPFPEETIRRMISQISELHLCFSETAREALVKEGHDPGLIRVVRNPLEDRVSDIAYPDGSVEQTRRVLVTLHRRERRDERLNGFAAVVRALAGDAAPINWRFIWHPSLDIDHSEYRGSLESAGVEVLPALGPNEFLTEVRTASAVLTDSAGVAEECQLLGKPLVSFRLSTEQRFDDSVTAAFCITESPTEAAAFLKECFERPFDPMPAVQVGEEVQSAAAMLADSLEAWLKEIKADEGGAKQYGDRTTPKVSK